MTNLKSPNRNFAWLTAWMEEHKIVLYGVADLEGFSTPLDRTGRPFPTAISWVIPMKPEIMKGIRDGPNQTYSDEYARVNERINAVGETLTSKILSRGGNALPLAASDRTNKITIRGDFPHKTAATRADLGWIGRHCQLITRPFGPWVRLGTVFTDMDLPSGTPMEKGYCGRCMLCVEACPANALTGKSWHPGILREEILDVHACDRWKKTHYMDYHQGHNCGICTSVCPYGLKQKNKIEN